MPVAGIARPAFPSLFLRSRLHPKFGEPNLRVSCQSLAGNSALVLDSNNFGQLAGLCLVSENQHGSARLSGLVPMKLGTSSVLNRKRRGS